MQLPKLSDVSVARWFAGFLANEFLETLIVKFGLYISLILVNVNNTYNYDNPSIAHQNISTNIAKLTSKTTKSSGVPART